MERAQWRVALNISNKWFLITVKEQRAERQEFLGKRFTCMTEDLIEAVLQERYSSKGRRVLRKL